MKYVKLDTSKSRGECADLQEPTNKELLWEILRIGFPLSASQLSQFGLMVVMFFFAGHLGVEELGSVSIALGIFNATGFAFGSGLCGALETLLSHSYGQDPRSTTYGVYAQRMFLILMLFAIPLAVLLGCLTPILVAIGEPAHVVVEVSSFCVICIFGLPPIMLLELLRRYYACQQRSNPVFVTLAMAAIINPIIQYVFVSFCGYKGIALGWVILIVVMDIALLVYLRLSGLYRHTWGGWSKAAFKNWIPILKLAIPSLGMTFSEWSAMEVNSVCAGFMSPVHLGAYAISGQIANLCWSAVSGFFMASTVLVGNCVGERRPELGKRYAIMSFLVVSVCVCVNTTTVYMYRKEIAYIFTEDTEAVSVFVDITPFFLVYHVLDSIQCNFLGILRGCGLQIAGVVIAFVSLTIVGMPLGLFLFFRCGYAIQALWIGPIVGCASLGLPACLFVFFYRINWKRLQPHVEAPSALTNEVLVSVVSCKTVP
ncbi:putative membrane transporter protein [Trypanosoma rangeli]|uniref:Putative membrane transporter protein n=1 Tax=Trypanosoma rangeli TaxID=5698 RepID=A0A422NR58_TRYRA|nr:putative membrane transporter protein [Trypanosoma rangeli]RNF07931.1 putative membrane transporter protein [Trypanosoma rangeli]|eukprot:RNF07931.1 putative membrane transporter protein [Trypanosoma rangeli]